MSVLADTMASRRGAGAHRPLLAVLHEWVVTVDHKRLGVMYVVSGLVFLVVAGLEASAMRLQLAWSGLHVVPPGTFNQLFTMHGTTMVFLVGIPIVFGFGNYLVPLMIGARDLAFPRLNAFGFWIFLFGGLLLHFSFLGGEGLYGGGAAPAIGWFAYAPLTERAFTPGNATDYWNLARPAARGSSSRSRGWGRSRPRSIWSPPLPPCGGRA
jgi:cytochrome c oxidase subunit 1